jgi:hypothetical protein
MKTVTWVDVKLQFQVHEWTEGRERGYRTSKGKERMVEETRERERFYNDPN